MGLFTRSTLDSNINGAAKMGHRAVQGASDAVDTASTQLRGLLDDLDSSIRDAKDIDVDKLRKDLQAKLKAARTQFDGSSSAIAGRLNDAAGYADEFVHDKPWHTLGEVAGLQTPPLAAEHERLADVERQGEGPQRPLQQPVGEGGGARATGRISGRTSVIGLAQDVLLND